MVLERLYVIPHGDEIIDVPNQEIVRNIAAEFGREMVTVNFATSSGPLSD